MKQKLIDAIVALVAELRSSGKFETAEYYTGVKTRIIDECSGNRDELRALVEQLERSGSIVQYADFSAREERLWNVMYDCAVGWGQCYDKLKKGGSSES